MKLRGSKLRLTKKPTTNFFNKQIQLDAIRVEQDRENKLNRSSEAGYKTKQSIKQQENSKVKVKERKRN